MRELKGKESFGKSAYERCLVPNVKAPPKFKVPDFEKFKGDTNPNEHLTSYVRRMSMYTDDDKLLIQCFQDSLTGAALRWYMNLDSSQVSTFRDLADTFVAQYRYNLDLAPDRDQLRSIAQRDKETFKEYAQR